MKSFSITAMAGESWPKSSGPGSLMLRAVMRMPARSMSASFRGDIGVARLEAGASSHWMMTS